MIRLHPLFSTGAVLQRGKVIPVFGSAAPNARLRLAFRGLTMVTTANLEGKFLFRLPPMEGGGPSSLRITDCRTEESAVADDLLIGEVWLASGQSNMEYALARSVEEAVDFRRENQGNDSVRIFTVPKRLAFSPLTEPESGCWISAADDRAGEGSAVALWFAQKLGKELGVPVGILSSSWGGSIIEAWISRKSLNDDPVLGEELPLYDAAAAAKERWEATAENLLPPALIPDFEVPAFQENGETAKEYAAENTDDSSWERMKVPGDWIEQKLSGHGSIWIRRSITLPENWAGKDLELFMGPVDKQDITFFNGQEIGRTGKMKDTEYWILPRHYRIPGKWVHAGRNTLAVRAFSFFRGAGFGGSEKDYFVTLAGKSSGKRIFFAGEAAFRKEYDMGVIPPGNEWYLCRGEKVLFQHHPSILFDSLISPLIPYAIRGVLWYQGESNAAPAERVRYYQARLMRMIRDWRFHWGQGGEIPFLIVQLANFRKAKEYAPEESWPQIRQAQWQVVQQTAGCGIVAAHDSGEADDLHPKEKRRVGIRLAEAALHQVYSLCDGAEPCPVPEEIRAEGNTLRIRFRHALRGLVLEAQKKSGFRIASQEHFYPAEAKVEGDTLILSSPRVAAPRRVRYAWADNPRFAALYNRDGNPAIAFEMSL